MSGATVVEVKAVVRVVDSAVAKVAAAMGVVVLGAAVTVKVVEVMEEVEEVGLAAAEMAVAVRVEAVMAMAAVAAEVATRTDQSRQP